MAAAALTLFAGVAFADPSQATGADTAPAIPYIAHAAASIDAGALASGDLELPETLSHDIDFSSPVAAHAVAAPSDEAAGILARDGVGGSLASMVDAYSRTDPTDAQQACLAGAIYYESKGEPLEGQLAVAEVILNRAASGRFPATICGVVTQRSQFSFVRGGRIPDAPRSSIAWRKAVAIAHIAQQDLAESKVSDAMFFHANYVRPGWRNLRRVASVGNHIFYR